MIVTYFENLGLARVETLAPSSTSRMDNRETPAAKVAGAATLQRIHRDICAFAIFKTFPTQGDIRKQKDT